jgi:SSS family transporter
MDIMYDSGERLILGSLVIIYFMFLFGISFYINKKSIKTYDDYNVAGRSVKLFPLILTFTGTAVGGAILLGYMQQGFIRGMGPQWLNFGIFLAGIFILAFYLKRVRALGEKYTMVTIADFTVLRFGEGARIPTVVSLLVAYSAITGMQFVAIATILNLTLGTSITTGVIVSGILVTLKTYFGGMKSVIWQDAFHGTIQTVGIFILFCTVLIAAGGLEGVQTQVALSSESDFLSFFNIPASEVMVYILTIGGYQFVRQDLWQRFWAADSAKTAQTGFWIAIVLAFLTGFVVILIGIMGRFGLNLPLENASLTYFAIIGDVFSFPMIVVMVLALLATVISTADSFFMAGASSIINDIIKPRLKPSEDLDQRLLKYSRYSVLGVAGIAFTLAIFIPDLIVLWIMGSAMLVSSLLAPITAGLFWKKATRLGGTVAMWVGLVIAVVWQVLGHPFGIHPVFIGLPLSIFLVIVVSLMTRDNSSNI